MAISDEFLVQHEFGPRTRSTTSNFCMEELIRTQWFYHDENNEKWPKESEVDEKGTRWFRIGPIAVEHPNDMKLIYDQQKYIWRHTWCWPVIRYRPSWRIMGRVIVHDKMQGMLWL